MAIFCQKSPGLLQFRAAEPVSKINPPRWDVTDKQTNPIKILYVEDQKDVQRAIQQLLSVLGYEVVCADNGQHGVDLALSWLPDVILMDIRMPVMDGVEATRLIRQNSTTAHIPVIVLSAFTDQKTRDECNQVGVNGFLAKPISIHKLTRLLEQILG